MSQRLSRHIRRAITHAPRGRPGSSGNGQALVEFAMIFPLMMVLLMATIEFALAFQASLGINHASQNAVLVATEAGNTLGADCLILRSIEADVYAPNDKNRILEVQIQRTGPAGGKVYSYDAYARSGSTTCTLVDGSHVTVPYTATSLGYPNSQRCNIVGGCPTLSPARTTVDTIAVQLKYTYTWRTPLGTLTTIIGGTATTSTGWTFSKRNVSRMEPLL